jgi:hypothetical protein
MELTLLVLLALLSVKHFLADFVFQSQHMIETKGIYGASGGLHHAFVHGMLTAFVLLPIIPQVIIVLQLAFVDAFLHYHIDWAKMKIGRKYNYTPSDRAFWFWIGLDQLLHYLTYIGITAWVFLIITL